MILRKYEHKLRQVRFLYQTISRWAEGSDYPIMKAAYQFCLFILCAISGSSLYAQALTVNIVYIEQQRARPPVLSNLVVHPEDEGEQGALLGIADNNTTGKFLQHDYVLRDLIVAPEDDVIEAARAVLAGRQMIVTNLPADKLQRLVALPEAQDDLFFNAGSAHTALRDDSCHPNLLHTLPSRAMLSDALMQFFNKRKWDSVFLLEGQSEVDTRFADSIRASAKKYRISIDHEKRWIDNADLRRNAAAEIPLYTQARQYEVVVVADENDEFGQYVLYNTWLPRPVAGTAGLEPVAWDRVVEQWGAAQLQSRFQQMANRTMTSIDYATWAAVRTIGEVVTRTKGLDPTAIKDYIFTDKFALSGFKGAKLTYRRWNGQLRQPIPLVHPQSVVALAPLEGFLHHRTELDTLGLDEPESNCKEMN